MAGGASGAVLDDLLDRRALPRRRVPIADHTCISHPVFERSRGLEYCFVPDGPVVTEAGWQPRLEALERIDVLSGSLPRGVSDEFYYLVAEIAARGAPGSGSIPREKPCARPWQEVAATGRAESRGIPEAGRAQARGRGAPIPCDLAVTMGGDGALIATKDGVLRFKPPDMTVMIAVGRGR